MTEYLFYFITVLGVLVLRRQSTPASVGYRTSILNPLLFCFVSAMIVARNAISQLTQVVLIAIFFALGATIYRMSWWQRFVGRTEPEFQA